ncbi:MAG: RluA family pseudouridine synthase [Spirochaetaceae bacterium]|jgi:23S rRNA pseudouridine955/2504/2580 synthase|nr:RluA family pseudouridine synthase [Spirochaetaceae bacterium]
MKTIEVLYEDDECLVLNKPAGLPVQGGKGASVNLDAILAGLREPRPLLTHRLDKGTSGVILTAKTPAAAAWFTREFASKAAKKQYLALCALGKSAPNEREGTIRTRLSAKGVLKDALTRYRLLETAGGFALFRLEPGTGRMHQIRRHLSQEGLPVIGDDRYGDFALNRRLRGEAGVKKMLLHASRLSIPLQSGHALEVSAPLPGYFLEALAVFGISVPAGERLNSGRPGIPPGSE